MKFCAIWITTKNKKEAKKIATTLLENSLIACAEISKIESHYIWNNKIEKSKERLLVVKTKSSLYKKIEKFVLKIHSYDTPQIIKTDITDGDSEYLKWIENNTKA
jgi:periplasmic divalent cation tolerance protein